MNVNVFNNTIELTKTEAKEIRTINSEAYLEFVAIRNQFPTFRHVIKSAPRKKDCFKHLTYDFMRKYITTQGGESKDEIMKEFDSLIGNVMSENEDLKNFRIAASSFDVRKWFLNKFPEFKEFRDSRKKEIQKIMDSVA